MPDSAVVITAGTGTSIDTRTEDTNSQHRQVIVVGGPSVNAAVAEVASVDPGSGSTSYGQVVRIAGSATIQNIVSSVAVYFDRANPAVSANYGTGTFLVAFDRANPSVSIGGASASIGIYFDRANPAVNITSGTVTSVTNTVAVYFDRANPAVSISDPFGTAVGHYTAQGTASSAGGAGLNTVVSAEAGRNIKVYAYSFTTTAQVGLSPRFTDGSSAAGTTYWRIGAMQAPAQGIAGSNLAVNPPGFIFATGSGNSLSIYLDSASLVHYSVGYFKESA